jgi:hypothetical protein
LSKTAEARGSTVNTRSAASFCSACPEPRARDKRPPGHLRETTPEQTTASSRTPAATPAGKGRTTAKVLFPFSLFPFPYSRFVFHRQDCE